MPSSGFRISLVGRLFPGCSIIQEKGFSCLVLTPLSAIAVWAYSSWATMPWLGRLAGITLGTVSVGALCEFWRWSRRPSPAGASESVGAETEKDRPKTFRYIFSAWLVFCAVALFWPFAPSSPVPASARPTEIRETLPAQPPDHPIVAATREGAPKKPSDPIAPQKPQAAVPKGIKELPPSPGSISIGPITTGDCSNIQIAGNNNLQQGGSCTPTETIKIDKTLTEDKIQTGELYRSAYTIRASGTVPIPLLKISVLAPSLTRLVLRSGDSPIASTCNTAQSGCNSVQMSGTSGPYSLIIFSKDPESIIPLISCAGVGIKCDEK
jgi:hypothetical protein